MTARRKSGFESYVRARMREPAFASEYESARREIDAIDRLVRQLDGARVAAHVSKAELARRIGARPEVLRRLFTAEVTNPTISTLVRLAGELGYEVALVPVKRVAAKRSKRVQRRTTATAR